MRLNLDSKALTDPRFAKLGQRCKPPIHKRLALGLCLDVWMFCYESRSELLAADDIDALADLAGFADAMIAAGLAVPSGALVRLAGVKDRIGFLELQDKKLRRANEAKLAAADARATAAAVAPADATGTSSRHLPIPHTLDLDQSHPPSQPPTPDRRTEDGGGEDGGVSMPAESARLTAASAGPETRRAIDEMVSQLSPAQITDSLAAWEASGVRARLVDAGADAAALDERRAEWVRNAPAAKGGRARKSRAPRARAAAAAAPSPSPAATATATAPADTNPWRSPW